jgi:hypothetical protein
MDTLKVNCPNDIKQTPDIIIYIYSKASFSGEQKIGYIRVPAREC